MGYIAEVTDHPPTMVQRGKRTGMAVNGFVSQEGLLPYPGDTSVARPSGGLAEGSGKWFGRRYPDPWFSSLYSHLLRSSRADVTKATSCPGDHSTKVLVNEDGPIIYRLYSVNSHVTVMIHDDTSDLTSATWMREGHDPHHRERKTRGSE